MDYLNDPQFLRQLIMDHYEFPRHKEYHEDYKRIQMSTDSCIDDLTIQAKLVGNRLVDVCFIGDACTIATSSASMMCDLLHGKTVQEALYLIDQFNKMLKLESFDEKSLGELVALQNVGKQPHRITCANLAWRGIELLVKEDAKNE